MRAFTVNVASVNEGYKVALDVNPVLMEKGDEDGKKLIKKLCLDILALIDDVEVEEGLDEDEE